MIREPLLHFLLLGMMLFWLFHVVSGGRGSRGGDDHRIVVDAVTVAGIVQRYQGVWQRPPTPAELQGLIDAQVREEILYRHGAALGLDRDEAVIRRRVLQKLDVITEEAAASSAASEAELQAYLETHAERYGQPATIGFDQVMFDPVRHGEKLDADVAAALVRLRAGGDPATTGDSSLLPTTVPPTPTDLLSRDFGEEFIKTLSTLPIGGWLDPVASGYGVHLVRVTSRTPGRPATLAEVHAAVERDRENDRRLQAKETYFQTLRRSYDVVVETAAANGSTPPGGGP